MYATMDLGVLAKTTRETDISVMLSKIVEDGKRVLLDVGNIVYKCFIFH